MGLWRDKIRGDWRYSFQYHKEIFAAGGFQTKGDARSAREQRRKEVKSPQKATTIPTGMGFLEIVNQYLDWSDRRHAPGHVENKKVVFRKMMNFFGITEEKDLSILELTAPRLHEFFMSAPSNNSYNVYRKETSALFAWAQKHLQPDLQNPCNMLEKMPSPKKERTIPTKEEFLRILAACPPDDKPLLLVLAHTLARIDEILRLTWQDVNFDKGTLTLWSRKNRGGEWRPRTIGMNTDLTAMLKSMWNRRKQEKWVFLNQREGDRYLRRPKLMRSICRVAEVKHYTFHQIRHFIATYLHDVMKVPTGVLSGILGHENKRTTEIYLHSVDEAQREALTRLEGFFGDQNMLAAHACGFKKKRG